MGGRSFDVIVNPRLSLNVSNTGDTRGWGAHVFNTISCTEWPKISTIMKDEPLARSISLDRSGPTNVLRTS